MHVRDAYFIFILVWFTASSFGIRAEEPAPSFLVIVHPDNQIQQVDKAFLAEIFLKKARLWPQGQTVHPVDLRADRAARRYFTKSVIKRSVAEVKNYWQQIIFSGRDIPPPELTPDLEVIKFVRTRRGAIGYVSRSADTKSVKILQVP